jgi:hypothetical protein
MGEGDEYLVQVMKKRFSSHNLQSKIIKQILILMG